MTQENKSCNQCIYRYGNLIDQGEYPFVKPPDGNMVIMDRIGYMVVNAKDTDEAREILQWRIDDDPSESITHQSITPGYLVCRPSDTTCSNFKEVTFTKNKFIKSIATTILRSRSLFKKRVNPEFDYVRIFSTFVVCVDFDDTVISSGHFWIEADRILLEENGIEYDKDEFLSNMGDKTFDGIFQMIHDIYLPNMEVNDIKERILEIVADQYDHAEFIQPVIDYVNELKQHALTTVVITTSNISALVDPALSRSGLQYDHIITTDNHVHGFKTKKEMLQYVKEVLLPNCLSYTLIDDNGHCLDSAKSLFFHTLHPDDIIVGRQSC